jgi:hypothetical protein
MIVIYSEDENDEGLFNLKMRVTFTDYPLATSPTYPNKEAFWSLQINPATCDCSLITWDNPAMLTLSVGVMYTGDLTMVKATTNEDSKSASPAIRACYRNGGNCDEVSILDVVDDSTGVLDGTDSFMTMSGLTLTVVPTTSSHIAVY